MRLEDWKCECLRNFCRQKSGFILVINPKKLSLYAGFVSRYGDERALPFLLEAIERDKISYADFEELRFAIESLGGEYNKERDFSSDKSYKAIKGISLKKK